MKASKRRRRANRSSKQQIDPAPAPPAFTADEEAFFREGAALSAASSADALTIDDVVEPTAARPPSLWRRLFTRAERARAA